MIDCRIAAVTLSAKTLDVIPLCVAPMLAVPAPTPVAIPVALTAAADRFEDDHVAELVSVCVVPSLKVPVAVNWSVVPLAIDDFGAVIVIDCSTAAVTVRVMVLELTPACEALTFVDPTPVAVASPAAFMDATAELEELHTADWLMSCEVPSLNLPVAVNGSVKPLATEEAPALIVIDCSVAAVTASANKLDETPLRLALTLVEPCALPLASPEELRAATAVFDDFHVTDDVMSCELPSLKAPVAVN